jgi:hypothetical protein
LASTRFTTERSVTFLTTIPDITFDWSTDGTFTLAGAPAAGLYRLTLRFAIAEPEWERFYYAMHQHGNSGERTGPWDFDGRDKSRPLVPAWRICRDQREVGYCWTNRPDNRALRQRELEAALCFHSDGSALSITGTPYAAFTLAPAGAVLEADTRDELAVPPWAADGFAVNWLHTSGRDDAWAALQRELAESDDERLLVAGADIYVNAYQPPATSDGTTLAPCPIDALPLLVMAWRVEEDEAARAQALAIIRHYLDADVWGRPNADGYGHNCDMFCATVIKSLVIALNWLDAETLGDLRQPLVDRLTRQIEIFLELQLLHCNYWGGAISQDHGYRSTFCLAVAAIGMLGHTPHAAAWLAFYLPRSERCLAALPTDGFMPFTNYHKVSLYGMDLADLAIVLEGACGRKLLAEYPATRCSAEFLLSSYDETVQQTLTCCPRGDAKGFSVGLSYLYALDHQTDSDAARYLAGQLMAGYREQGFRIGSRGGKWAWKVYSYLPFALLCRPRPALTTARPARPALAHFPDGGGVHFRAADGGLAAAVYCLPPAPSFHAVGTDLSPTDRITANAAAGNFSVSAGGEVLLQQAESGYRTGSHLGNVMLIDGTGQIGDVRSPNGIFDERWHGQRINWVRPTASGGTVRMDLRPAYDEALQLLAYTRDLTFDTESITLVDTIVSRTPHRYACCFHTYASRHVKIDFGVYTEPGNVYIKGARAALELCYDADDWQATTAPTAVVWAYGNEQSEDAFQQVRFESLAPTTAVQFTLTIRQGIFIVQ